MCSAGVSVRLAAGVDTALPGSRPDTDLPGGVGSGRSHDHGFGRAPRPANQVVASLRVRPNPSMLSYEEAARAVLGDSADEYLSRLSRLLASQPLSGVGAVAYVTATR